MLKSPGIIVAPGAYDGISARLIERQGFKAVYMTGAGTAASVLGQPDIGLTTLTEMTTHAAHIASCVSLPVIADADTGYGNALNVIRTVREYERAGVAAIHLEDQVFPKRCGHIAGKAVISSTPNQPSKLNQPREVDMSLPKGTSTLLIRMAGKGRQAGQATLGAEPVNLGETGQPGNC